MLKKIALCDVTPLEIIQEGNNDSIKMIRTASKKIVIEPNSEKAKIVEAEIKKHPNALFFRAKAIEANIPNTNGDYFSEEELLKAYKTFEGVPFFTNHDNQNIENAKGKIIFAEWDPKEKAVYTISFVDRDAYPHISRSIEEEYITGVSMGFLGMDSEITMADLSSKKICDINVGDKVLTPYGNQCNVTKIYSDIIATTMHELDLVTYHKSPLLSYDHPLFIIPSEQIAEQQKESLRLAQSNKCLRTKKLIKEENFVGQDSWRTASYSPVFRETLQCKNGDYILIPSKYNLIEKNSSEDEKNLSYLSGAYVGDGYISKENNNDFSSLKYYIGLHEKKDLCEKICRLLPHFSEAKICKTEFPERNGMSIGIYDKKFSSEMYEKFGRLSHDKRIYKKDWTKDEISSFVSGYIDTDGTIAKNYNKKQNGEIRGCGIRGVLISSCNQSLLEDVQSLLILIDTPSYISWNHRIPNKNSLVKIPTIDYTLFIPFGNIHLFSESIKVSSALTGKETVKNKAGKVFIFTDKNSRKHMACPIKGMTKKEYSRPCYDLKVEGDECYIADGISVHNCSVEYSVCNVCGNKAEQTLDYCIHIQNRKGRKFSGKAKNVTTGETKDFKDQLVFEYNYGIKFIELSAVVDPACPTCHIQGIIPNNEYLKRVANIQNTLMMIKTAAIEKQAGQEELQQLEQVLKTLEDLAIKLIQQRKQVEPEFASDLVKIITDLQTWTDELTAAGYGNFQGEIPGTAGNMPPEQAPAQPPAGGAPLPVAEEAPMPEQPTEPVTQATAGPVGQTTGAPGKPLVSGPSLPITAPVRPTANSSQSIQRISDYSVDRMKHGENLLSKVANIVSKLEKLGDDNMAKRRTIAAKTADKEKTIEILSNSWKEKQQFFEYIKEVPSIQDNDIKLSVKEKDDTFIIVAETKDSPVVSKVWTYDDLNDEQKEMIRQNPQGAAVELLECFANSVINYKEGVKNMTNIDREAGANSVQKTPEVITQKQLDDNSGYHSRTGVEQEVVTQKQLAPQRKGEQEVITEKQLDGTIKLNPRTSTEAEVVTQKQLDSVRTGVEKEVITQKQLDEKRSGEQEVITEKQLDSVDAAWARQAKRDASLFKSASQHMEGVVDVVADTVLASGCTPNEACDVAGNLVGSPKSRYDLSKTILTAPETMDGDFAKRLAYWRNKNFKIASTSKAEIADLIVNGLKKLAADTTINPDVVVSAIDVIGEGNEAVVSVAKRVDQKLSEAAETYSTKKVSIKDELRQALTASASETTLEEREKERVNLLASITSRDTRQAERKDWEKKLNQEADTIIETTFEESGLNKKDPNFKKNVVAFTKGALSSRNIKLASITNVTISGNTIQIAVQTDDGEQSVEIPLGQSTGPSPEEVMPEGDLSGEGLEQQAPPMAPTAANKAVKKVAQVPAGGGVPGAPGGVTAPGAPEAALPGGTPSNDPIQALTTGDEMAPPEEAAEEIPTSSDRQMPWSICPECGTSDVDVTKEDDGGIMGQCKNPECGAKYEALVKKEIEYKIITPKKGTEGAGAGGPELQAPEAPEVPALPVAAQTRVDKNTIIRIGKNKKENGHVCPSCGKKNCKASRDNEGHAEYTCEKCGTETTKDVVINKNKPEDSYLRVAWNVFPEVKGCSSCEEKAKKLASRLKMEGLLKKAAIEKNDFPMTNCMERVARKYGGNTVATYGPCKGKPLPECVCKELQRLGFRTVRQMEKLANASVETDPLDQCMKEQKEKGLTEKQASSICNCVKNKVISEAKKKDAVLAESMDNFYLSAFLDDIKNGKEKTVTAEQLIALKEIDQETKDVRVAKKVAAQEAELDKDIGSPLPKLINLKETNMDKSNKVSRVAATPKLIETIEKDVSAGVPRKNQTLGNEGPDNIDVNMAKPNVPRGNAEMGHEGAENINPAAGLPDIPVDNSLMGGEKDTQKNMPAINNEIKGTVIAEVKNIVVRKAKNLKEVDTVEFDAEVPRGNATLGHEGKDNIDVNMAKPEVPRGDAAMGHEGKDNIDVDMNKADVPMSDEAYMGHEKDTLGDPKNNDEMLKNVAAKREKQLDRIAQARFNEAVKTASWLSSNGRIASDKETFDSVVKALSAFDLGQIAKVAEQMFPIKQVKTSSTAAEVKEAGHSIPSIIMESKSANQNDDFAKKLSSQFTIGNRLFDEKLTIYGEK